MHDQVWKALADPTRRAVLDQLAQGPKTTGELCEAFPSIDRCTVMKHLEVLVRANLVLTERRGRNRYNSINPLPLHQIVERWVTGHTARLARSAQRLKEISEQINGN